MAPLRRVETAQGTRLKVYLGRLVLWSGVILLAGWLLVATALFFNVKYNRGFKRVSYSHLIFLPLKWEAFKRAKGEYRVEQGIEASKEGKWLDAYSLLRSGLPDAPDNREGRLLLCRIYLMARRTDSARQLLVEGLPYHTDQLDYLRVVLDFLFSQQADGAVIEVTQAVLDKAPLESPLNKLARASQAIALFNRDRFAESARVLAEGKMENSQQAKVLAARTRWDLGKKEEALRLLRALHQSQPKEEEVYRTLVSYLNAEKRFSDVRSLSLARQLVQPEKVEPYVDYMQACAAEMDWERRDAAEREFIGRFQDDAAALARCLEYAAMAGRGGLANQVYGALERLGAANPVSDLARIRAFLEGKEYGQGMQLLEALEGRSASWEPGVKVSLGGLRALALKGLGKALEAAPVLDGLLESPYLTAPMASYLAQRLHKLGDVEAALRFYRKAVTLDPLYQLPLVELLRVESQRKDIAEERELIERLMTMRKPPRDLVNEIRLTLESDRYLFLAKRKEFIQKLTLPVQ